MEEYLALFPYTSAAARYVEASTKTLESLLGGGEFSKQVLSRSVERVTRAISGDAPTSTVKSDDYEVEILSYVLARALISCINETLLIQRYANAEAQDALESMQHADERSQSEYILSLLGDFRMPVSITDNAFQLYFTDFVRYTGRLRGPQWRLVNLLYRGRVTLAKGEIIQILAEAVRLKVLSGLPLKLSGKICEALSPYTSPLKQAFSQVSLRHKNSGPIILEACPPCIKALLSQVRAGRNLSHPARFALTAFLANVGMKAHEIVQIYQSAPDFDYELTRYQVEHIKGSSGTDYIPPGCSTMVTYGNCIESDGLCKRVNHPLSYYRLQIKRHAAQRNSGE
jgi:DNA primase large subunit